MLEFLKLIFDFSQLHTLYGVDAVLYAALALVGTALFLLRLIGGLLFGLGDALDFDADLDAHGDFGLFSMLSMTAFLMGTGWMGLVAQVDWGIASSGVVAVLSVGFGATMMLMAASLLFGMKRLAHEPHADPSTAIGRTGTVYMTVPPGGSGQVRVNVSGRSAILPARAADTHDGGDLPAFTDVRITAVRDDGTLLVEPLDTTHATHPPDL